MATAVLASLRYTLFSRYQGANHALSTSHLLTAFIAAGSWASGAVCAAASSLSSAGSPAFSGFHGDLRVTAFWMSCQADWLPSVMNATGYLPDRISGMIELAGTLTHFTVMPTALSCCPMIALYCANPGDSGIVMVKPLA